MADFNESAGMGRSRVTQVFQFLKALNQANGPDKHQIQDQPWSLWLRELPRHPDVTVATYQSNDSEADTDDNETILRVRRPKLTKPPTPPGILQGWLKPGWDQILGEAEVEASRNHSPWIGETKIIRFEDEPERMAQFTVWKARRDEWAANERPAAEVLSLFERFYELYGRIERDAERLELVLGDGILNWQSGSSVLHHPILLKRVQLVFRATVPEFLLIETDHPTELYSELFHSVKDTDGTGIGRCREELDEGGFHPLDGPETTGFLKRLVMVLSPNSEYVEEGEPQGFESFPRIGRSQVFFLRSRNQGFSTAIDTILEDIQGRQELPASLLNIVGVETPVVQEEENAIGTGGCYANEDDTILLSKPANPEQLQIARRLDKYGSILVQGPPGTGKTHTIANLVGHLLAQGKTILVTSHTTKALRVLREKVAKPLQPLCVSILENDGDSRQLLENSINAIVQRLSETTEEGLGKESEQFLEERKTLREQLGNKRHRLQEALADEYRDILVGTEMYGPADAARLVAEGKDSHGWIPGPVTLGAPIPLTTGELLALYQTNATLSETAETALNNQLPPPEELMDPLEFDAWVRQIETLSESSAHEDSPYWEPVHSEMAIHPLENLLTELQSAVAIFDKSESWLLNVYEAGRLGEPHRAAWETLLALMGEVHILAGEVQDSLLDYVPVLAPERSFEDQQKVLEEIIDHLESGKSLNWTTRLGHGAWFKLIETWTVKGKRPERIEEFRSLWHCARLERRRERLRYRWLQQATEIGAPDLSGYEKRPEVLCHQYHETLKSALNWYSVEWLPLAENLGQQAFRWETFWQEIPSRYEACGEVLRLRDAIREVLPKHFAQRIQQLNFQTLTQRGHALAHTLERYPDDLHTVQVISAFHQALDARDPALYRQTYQRLLEVLQGRTDLNTRQSLLVKLEPVAPAWANAIRNRLAPHDAGSLPGDVAKAWTWRQLYDELEKRGALSIDGLQREIEQRQELIRTNTIELIDRLAWKAQVKRTSLEQRQSLIGWLQTVKKIGKGTGKRAPMLQQEARKKMELCRSAVPVWILPMSRLVETFNLQNTRFDVVIIDEASQCDLMGLIALYLGKQVVIVGDHEQVSPDAVGQKVEEVQHLINENLQNIPNAQLYDGKMSVYDLAMASFGGTICLREHFRCVPEIIQFSNYLSYEGKIQPLRDAASVSLKPAVIPCRVEGNTTLTKTNRAEAEQIAALLMACLERPEYREKTFGVISLLGENQAKLIQSILLKHLEPVDFERHAIRCGIPPQFQGDERDVIFLSMVHGPKDTKSGTLSKIEADMYKKRYNVAASRAKDQLWIVHSLDTATDLKPGDLRRRLIDYAQNPQAMMELLEDVVLTPPSDLEQQVYAHFVAQGYRVVSQWRVGKFQIDMVIEGDSARLALECEGDRGYRPDAISEELVRQAILERLGWKFVRVRGSEFFREPELALKPVYERLNALEIYPDTEAGSELAEPKLLPSDSDFSGALMLRATELVAEWRTQTPVAEPALPVLDTVTAPLA